MNYESKDYNKNYESKTSNNNSNAHGAGSTSRHTNPREWRNVSAQHPCRVCGKTDYCTYSSDGELAGCRRESRGARKTKIDESGRELHIHVLIDRSREFAAASQCKNDKYRDKNNQVGARDTQVSRGANPTAPPKTMTPETTTPKTAPPDILHFAYSSILGKLTLSEEHEARTIEKRKITREMIDEFGYKTWPVRGRSKIAGATIQGLFEKFGGSINPMSVPGIVHKESDRSPGEYYWTLAGSPGIAIPVRDAWGRIVAIRIERDGRDGAQATPQDVKDAIALSEGGNSDSNSPSSQTPATPTTPTTFTTSGGKYEWLSGKKYGGATPGSPLHVAAPPSCPFSTAREVRITEGEHKANIAARLTGIPTISLPGVSSWRDVFYMFFKYYNEEKERYPLVRIAIDADASTNLDVASSLNNLIESLYAHRIKFVMETWDQSIAKGIDDILVLSSSEGGIQRGGIQAIRELDEEESRRVAASNLQSAREANPSEEEKRRRAARKILLGLESIVNESGVPALGKREIIEAVAHIRKTDALQFAAAIKPILKRLGVTREYTRTLDFYDKTGYTSEEEKEEAERANARSSSVAPKIVGLDGRPIDDARSHSCSSGEKSGQFGGIITDKQNGVNEQNDVVVIIARVLGFDLSDVQTSGDIQREILRNIPRGIAMPPRYAIGQRGITHETEQDSITVSQAVVIPTHKYEDITTGVEQIEITWATSWPSPETQWKSRIVSRSSLAATRKIVDLADYGLPVDTETSIHLVKWISAVLNHPENLGAIPRSKISTALGWIPGREGRQFLLGSDFFSRGMVGAGSGVDRLTTATDGDILGCAGDGGDGEIKSGNQSSNQAGKFADQIKFQSLDSGDESIAASITSRGDLSTWLDAVNKIALKSPIARLAIFASFAAPTLSLFGFPSFIVDLSGETSRGKTMLLRACASIWGNPDEASEDSFLKTWDTTRVGVERTAATLNNLPVILDDTKRAPNERILRDVIYNFTAGHSKGRGSIKSLQTYRHWRTVLLSSGEQPITACSGDGGTRARVLTAWFSESPFGDEDGSAQLVADTWRVVRGNYGVAGRRFVEFLVSEDGARAVAKIKDGIEGIRGAWIERVAAEEDGAARGVLSRVAEYMTAIDCAAILVERCFGVKWVGGDSGGSWKEWSDAIWSIVAGEAKEADRSEEAMHLLWSWCVANKERFYVNKETLFVDTGRGAGKFGEAVGLWEWDEMREEGSVSVFKMAVDGVLRGAGYEPNGIVRAWRDRGWIRSDTGRGKGRFTTKKVIGGCRARVIELLLSEAGIYDGFEG